jgi:hypothetical protein
MIYLHYKDTKTFGHSFSFLLIFKTLRASYLQAGNFSQIIKMPDERNYRFWIDTNLTIEDFKNRFGIQKVTKKEFNELWNSVYYDYKKGKFNAVNAKRTAVDN